MLNVQKFLKEQTIEELTKEPYNLKIKDYIEEGLVVLNYSQIDSPKNDPIIAECRGLILNRITYDIVARSFDRFFNYGEGELNTTHNIMDAKVLEKIDGSLITVYYWNNKWNVATRGMAFAEGLNAFGNTYRSVFDKAFDINKLTDEMKDFCFTFELISP